MLRHPITRLKLHHVGTIAMSLAALVMIATPADARRGGSFGSRGSRTYTAPPTTAAAPKQAAPVERSAADKQKPAQASANASRQSMAGQNRFGGMAKGLIGGLIAGGLIAMLMGGGFGALGGSGMMMALLQIAMLGGLIWLVLRLFRRKPALATAGGPRSEPLMANPFAGSRDNAFTATASPQIHAAPTTRDIAITASDQASFERLLFEVQDAFGHEDYTRLRGCTTPEVMSYLAEELSQNATKGQRNEVSGTELLEAEVAEAWCEGGTDYATIAMRYQSIDVMRDRSTGALIEGNPEQPSQTTELWTFARDGQNPWRLSAIQEA